MRLDEITKQEHFKKMLIDPKMADVEKKLIELIPEFKEKGWNMTYEINTDQVNKKSSFIVDFTIAYEDLGAGKFQNLNPDSNRVLMNKLFPNTFMCSVINRRKGSIAIHLFPHNDLGVST